MLKSSRNIKSHHISGKDIQRSGKYPLQYTSGQPSRSFLILFFTYQVHVPCVPMSTGYHSFITICNFIINSALILIHRHLVFRGDTGCSTHPGLGITKKGPPAKPQLSCMSSCHGSQYGRLCCQCEGSLKPRFVATKQTYLDNLRKNQLCFFRSF